MIGLTIVMISSCQTICFRTLVVCVVQIGELAGLVSDETKELNKSVPWRVIKDTRNFYVHAYGAIDLEAVWETITNDIPALRAACIGILSQEKK